LILTLEGKANVGIIANSLKVFEALSHHIYDTLANGTIEDIAQLAADLRVHGKNISLPANSWCNTERLNWLKNQLATLELSKELQEKLTIVINALETINQGRDAYTELSVLLSLAVDNAKNPTLSKINGS
jgi:hypothetical protein